MKSLFNPTTGWFGRFGRERSSWIVAGILLVMAVLGFGSMIGNSAIVDEVAHIPAGFSYIHYGDYRLNPEHPPLIKDLAALPLQLLNLKFPLGRPEWTTEVNGQWDVGRDLLYYLGNEASADTILFWARLPILLLALGFGAALYIICRRRFGVATALLALFFYALSPNIIAHATLVTTDLGASVFMFLAIVAFARFTGLPSKANMLLLSVAIAGAELAKFSAIILYPLLAVMTLLVVWVNPRPLSIWERLKNYFGGYFLASALSILWIWIYYFPQVRNMPADVQDRLITGSLAGSGQSSLAWALLGMNNLPVLKPLVQFLLGVALVFGRISSGNTTYFNGQVYSTGPQMYFPELFLVKTQVAFLVMMIVGAVFIMWQARTPKRRVQRLATHIRKHVLEWTLGVFIVFYFTISVTGKLDLGIRHILPIYTPLFVLTAIAVVKCWIYLNRHGKGVIAGIGFAALLLWYGASTVLAYPSYLSYFNEIIGGSNNADKYFADSSVDWGQDLLRFKTYVYNHPEIKHIAVDYFGGGEPAYYFCARRYDQSGQLVTDRKSDV